MRRLALNAVGVWLAMALPAPAEPLTEVQKLRLSTELYFEGMAQEDALLVLAAARLRKPVVLELSDRELPESMASVRRPLDWERMAEEAEVLAGEDAVLVGLIEDLRAETGKGMASGPLYNIAALEPGGQDTYPAAEFRGGVDAEAYVEAGAFADLNLTVRDAAGNLVCQDRDPSPIAYCLWQPEQTGQYVLTVENLGPSDAIYSLMTN